jgi:hypothetical protein
MDAKDLAKATLGAIDDWLDKEVVGFEPNLQGPPFCTRPSTDWFLGREGDQNGDQPS